MQGKILFLLLLDGDLDAQSSHSKPMTPRRVKRRSVTSRGTLPPSHQAPPPYLRRQSSSQYSSRRHKNPVSRLIQQQYSSNGSIYFVNTF